MPPAIVRREAAVGRIINAPGRVYHLMTNHRGDFDAQLMAVLPRLRIQALGLTRNKAAADDLVQEAVANALGARDSFTPGTNFRAWMHRILRNRFISDIRKQRPTGDIEDAPQAALAVSGAHEDSLVLKELHGALGRLPVDQREALFMIVLQGMSYEEVSKATGCAVGTAKSRVFRARRQLQAWLMGEGVLPASGDGGQVRRRDQEGRSRPVGTHGAPP